MHSMADSSERKLELKYCECCGGLWLRHVGAEQSRCGACDLKWRDLAGGGVREVRERARHEQKAAMQLATARMMPSAIGGRA